METQLLLLDLEVTRSESSGGALFAVVAARCGLLYYRLPLQLPRPLPRPQPHLRAASTACWRRSLTETRSAPLCARRARAATLPAPCCCGWRVATSWCEPAASTVGGRGTVWGVGLGPVGDLRRHVPGALGWQAEAWVGPECLLPSPKSLQACCMWLPAGTHLNCWTAEWRLRRGCQVSGCVPWPAVPHACSLPSPASLPCRPELQAHACANQD